MMMPKKIVLVALMTTAAACFPAVANAQQTEAVKSGLARGNEAAAVGADEIIVTAQRRAENLLNVPLSVSALRADDLVRSGVSNSNDLTFAVPGLTVGQQGSFNKPTIRGISSTSGGSAGDEPNVATYFDGVYIPDAMATFFQLTNIERIEVLKGPQGTLYGRNATGGAINIVTSAPSLDRMEGSASFTYGRFNYYEATAFASVPLVTDSLGASISAVKYGDDGYIRNVFLNKTVGKSDGYLIRGRTLFQATPNLKFELNGLIGKTANLTTNEAFALNGNQAARAFAPGTPVAPIFNPTAIPLSQLVADKPFTTANAVEPYVAIRSKMVDGHVEWDAGFANISALTSFGSSRGETETSGDFSPLNLFRYGFSLKTSFSGQDLVLASPGSDSRLTWLAGVSAFQSRSAYDPITATFFGIPVLDLNAGQQTRAFAVYGEATVEMLNNLFVTGGARYSRERKTSFYHDLASGLDLGSSKLFTNMSPHAAVRYEFARNSNIYMSFNKGFKSGGFNVASTVGAVTPVSPEKITAYEAGIKAVVMPGLRLEASAYHYDYTNLQVLVYEQVDGVTLSLTRNAAAAKIDGAELNAYWQATPNLSFNAGISLIDAKFSSFPGAVIEVPKPDLSGSVQTIADLTGKRLVTTPRQTFSIGSTWTQPLGRGNLVFNANAFFSGKFYLDLSNRLSQRAYEVVNGSITWNATGDQGLFVRVFGKNLTNQTYLIPGIVNGDFGDFVQANKPRWFGVTIGFRK